MYIRGRLNEVRIVGEDSFLFRPEGRVNHDRAISVEGQNLLGVGWTHEFLMTEAN